MAFQEVGGGAGHNCAIRFCLNNWVWEWAWVLRFPGHLVWGSGPSFFPHFSWGFQLHFRGNWHLQSPVFLRSWVLESWIAQHPWITWLRSTQETGGSHWLELCAWQHLKTAIKIKAAHTKHQSCTFQTLDFKLYARHLQAFYKNFSTTGELRIAAIICSLSLYWELVLRFSLPKASALPQSYIPNPFLLFILRQSLTYVA